MYRHSFFLYIFIVAFIPAIGQVQTSELILNSGSDKSIALEFDNDTYYYTDYYYTQGIELDLILPGFNSAFLKHVFPKAPENRKLFTGISLAQRLYTPKNIRDTLVQFNDRPFAATLELDYFMISRDELSGLRFTGRLRVGMIGPIAGGEQLQRKIHEWIESPDPLGWDYQITNDVILNYELFVNYPLYYNSSSIFGFTGGLRAGTLFDDLGIGVNAAFGKNQFLSNTSSIVPRSDSHRKPTIFFSADTYVKLVFYNATLQGGLFSSNDPYVLTYKEISKMVFTVNATVGIIWRGVSLSYGYNLLTRELKAGLSHSYGSAMLKIYF